MSNEKILVIEDDNDLSDIICNFLTKENYSIKKAFDGETGITLAKDFTPQLILLDIMLPKVDGMEVCRQIRLSSTAPIIIISAKSSDMDKLLLLGIGADDYLTKPFSLVELGARVRSHLRRYTSFSTPCVNQTTRVFGEITIDSVYHKVTVCGKNVELTSKEFKLLDYLCDHPSQVFSKEQLIDNVWGYTEYIDINTITVYIGRLREKLSANGACYIKTVWGVGYKWEM
ncbi:MAG: response regulator transcription factor [Oscillospiraceae bacterium]|nr:response regulator transcription factor [Oscillospiraceae bacterium]